LNEKFVACCLRTVQDFRLREMDEVSAAELGPDKPGGAK
jgi:hypothetical protein